MRNDVRKTDRKMDWHRKILAAVDEFGELSTRQLANILGKSGCDVRRIALYLHQRNRLVKVPSPKQGRGAASSWKLPNENKTESHTA